MSPLTPEQQAVVDAPMSALCVVACAGSGKTKTAVQRLVQMRRNLGDARGRVALLSFSNVAVDTFRRSYEHLARDLPPGSGRERVEIDTLDGFITSNILRPHAHRTMAASQAAYLVTGNESFLAGFTFMGTTYPLPITDLHLSITEGIESFFYMQLDTRQAVNPSVARPLIARLGRTGAYTHELGRYWAYRALKERPDLLAVIARRYPHILIDEAQDIGSVHQALLELLIGAGSCVTLIGDPNQGIYDFAGADGKFLRDYHQRAGVLPFTLKRNFRSVPNIVTVANTLCGRNDLAERGVPGTAHGAFFTGYKREEHAQLITAFRSALMVAGADVKNSAVLCRGRSLAEQVRGEGSGAGQGTVKLFATAAVLRDRKRDFHATFKNVAIAVVALLENPPPGLVSQLTQPARYPDARMLRRAIWAFARDEAAGLPAANLIADTQWHPRLLDRVKKLLAKLQTEFNLASKDKIGNKLAKKDLSNQPLAVTVDLADDAEAALRVDTVHQAKGESLDAVLYMALKDHAEEMLSGVSTEVGRIGYVAATRARDLLWVAVPQTSLKQLRPALQAKGFQEVGFSTISAAKS